MDDGKELNLNRISNIVMFFAIVCIITVFLNVFEIVNVINIEEDDISLIKKDTGIYSTFEGRFKNSEYPIVKIMNDFASEEVLNSVENVLDKKPKSYFKNQYIKMKILNLVIQLQLAFITFIFTDIVLSYLKHFNPFTNEILKKLKILQYYFLSVAILGQILKIAEVFYKNINLSIIFGTPYYNLLFFSSVYVIKSVIEHGKKHVRI